MLNCSRNGNVEKPKESIEIELLPQKKSLNDHQSFGHQLLSVMHFIFGQHLQVPPMDRSLGAFWNIIFAFHSFAVFAVAFFCTASSFMAFKRSFSNFGIAMFIGAGFLGSLECLLRIVYTVMRKSKIETIAAKVHFTLYHENLETDPLPFVNRLSRVITVMALTAVIVFIICLTTGYLSIFWETTTILDKLLQNNTAIDADQMIRESDYSVEIIQSWAYIWQVFYIWPSVLMVRILTGIVHYFSFFAIGRVMISDFLFYTWYSTIIHQYRQLAKVLPKVMDGRAGKEKLQEWNKCHHNLNELLKEVNSLTSPVIVYAVISTGLQIGIMSFTILNLYTESNAFAFTVYAISSMQQIVIYCVLGQKIKDSVNNLSAEAYKGSWMDDTGENKKQIALMVMASSDKNGNCLPGTPFFSMSLEFLASMASAVFTYFIVLIQLNKN
ncbi:uncharacterized protein LOC132197923 [Neocloeon triangulifer]|uniref:uncharacterized protein LOC132197923 n=1 Tax=Neocloeon triangulifer TaxID=2078957 RepID=UPI00286F87CC|nr:uncharacterized protein LOC132197923 [Neocloeon triangulifer]